MNTTATIRKQFIMDAQGREIGVILPIEDYIFVEPLLRQREQQNPDTIQETLEEKLRKIELAANDPLFIADLQEAMDDFKHADAEWWERET
jgi:hypothetical protein